MAKIKYELHDGRIIEIDVPDSVARSRWNWKRKNSGQNGGNRSEEPLPSMPSLKKVTSRLTEGKQQEIHS